MVTATANLLKVTHSVDNNVKGVYCRGRVPTIKGKGLARILAKGRKSSTVRCKDSEPMARDRVHCLRPNMWHRRQVDANH
jgi:hypothetical protein